MIHPNVYVFLILLISCWVVAASLMAEKTWQSLMQVTHMCGKKMRRNRISMLTGRPYVTRTRFGRLKPRNGFFGGDTRTRLEFKRQSF